jgi:peptidoglycan/xylan/chitin deacetylase (PgdA/CDA1 family)
MDPNPNISFWNSSLWKTGDPLFNEIAYGSSGMQFFLGHHTFSHENLNNVTYKDALLQIRLNQVRVPRCPCRASALRSPPCSPAARQEWCLSRLSRAYRCCHDMRTALYWVCQTQHCLRRQHC